MHRSSRRARGLRAVVRTHEGLPVALARPRAASDVAPAVALRAADHVACQRGWILAARQRAEVASAASERVAAVLALRPSITVQPRAALAVGVAMARRRVLAHGAAVTLERHRRE